MGASVTALILERCAQTIEQVILPALTAEFVSGQLMAIAVVLHTLAPLLEVKGEVIREENDLTREVLERVLETLREREALPQDPAASALREKLDSGLETKTREDNEENLRLKSLLADTIKGLDALATEWPDQKISELRRRIRTVLKRQIDRKTYLVGTVEHLHLPSDAAD